MNIYQVTSRPRHMRYMYFIDEKYSYDELLRLILANTSWWGGRYNPIALVRKGKLADGYLQIIKHYDPDLIFHSNGVKPREVDMAGVSTFYMLSNFDKSEKVMLPKKYRSSENILSSFYELNFGLSTTPYHHEYEMTKTYQRLLIDDEAFSELNKTIHQQKPINIAALAKTKLNTKVLRNLAHANYNDFELVIARDKTSISDLMYYWNRGLYENKNLMYVTIEQLEELCKDKFFGGVLHDLQGEHPIRVVSMTLSETEIDKLIQEQLRQIAFHSNFRYFNISHFPYEVLDAGGLYERNYGEVLSNQTLVSDQGLTHLPKPSFGGNPVYSAQSYAVDLTITQDSAFAQTEIRFPFTTETWHIAREMKGRINRNRDISLFIDSQKNTADVFKMHVPAFKDLVRQLICSPVVHGEKISNKIVGVGPHDASNRLNAFINTFKGKLDTIQDFFSDKFWVDIFEELSVSEKPAGDALTFSNILDRAIAMYKTQKLGYIVKGRGWFNLENLTLGLKATLTELTDYQVFFKGFKLKCPKCSSIFWYHINDVKSIVSCHGCLQNFDLPVEPQFAYKLNDLIKNNIFQTKSSRDGNLTVIRSLAAFQQGTRGFQYSSQINLYDDYHSNKPFGDLDIVFTENGKLVIGEAKYNSNGFFDNNSKSLISLVETSKLIYPDKVVLTCSLDENGRLEKAKASLKHLFNKWVYEPEIQILLLHKADYWHIKSHRYFV